MDWGSDWGVYTCKCSVFHKAGLVVARDDEEAEDFFRQQADCGSRCITVEYFKDLPEHVQIDDACWFTFSVLQAPDPEPPGGVPEGPPAPGELPRWARNVDGKLDEKAIWINGLLVRAKYSRSAPAEPGIETSGAEGAEES